VVITEAEAYGLHHETLASMNDIKEFIVAANEEEEHATKVMKGFRKHLIGEKLQRVKHGHGVNFSWDNANSRLSVAM
jgi:hypothetical protein